MKKLKQIDDGIIKFDTSKHVKSEVIPNEDYQELEKWRIRLFKLKLIGEYLPQKIGYGNISVKIEKSSKIMVHRPEFLITGSQTGGLANLDGNHYVKIIDYNFDKLIIKSCGPILPSSESLTHAAIYTANPSIKSVFHIHNHDIWSGMLSQNYLKTNKSTPYGTALMAKEVKGLIMNKCEGVIVLEGHQDGVIAFSKSSSSCFKLIQDLAQKFIIGT